MKRLSRMKLAVIAVPFFIVLPVGRGQSQSTLPSSSSLQDIQRQALSALLPTAQVNTIQLNGSFQLQAGSLTQNGSMQFSVGMDGSYQVTSSQTTGVASESRTMSNGFPACTWTDQTGTVHKHSFLNCVTPAWFFPGLALLSPSTDLSVPAWSPTSYTSDALGNHLQLQFTVPIGSGTQQNSQPLSFIDLVLAADTNLPAYAFFTIHPNNRGLDANIPVKITYSDYRNVSGAMIPFHVQKFVNGSLVLDVIITTASVQ